MLLKRFLCILLIKACWSLTLQNETLGQDELETTTIYDYSSSECITNKGEQGKCMQFSACFPILSQDDDVNANNHLDALRDEIIKTSENPSCPGESQVCCSIGQQNFDEALLDDEETASDSIGGAQDIFPKECGRSGSYHYSSGYYNGKYAKITGGRNAINGQHPWMVAIFGKNGKITCGATLLTNNFLLTAAHCLSTYNAQDVAYLKVHIGDFNIKSTSDGPHEVRRISKIIVHKKFDIQTYRNDIALMKLDRPVNFTGDIEPICLPNADYNALQVEKREVIVTGWGRDSKWGLESSILKMVEMPVWNYKECERVFNIFAPNRLLPSMNICAGDGKKNKDACIGDSGGPLIYKIDSRWTQLGIISWGKGCGSFPGVYTAVQAHLPWIEKQIRTR